jgi:hypothetical protein
LNLTTAANISDRTFDANDLADVTFGPSYLSPGSVGLGRE